MKVKFNTGCALLSLYFAADPREHPRRLASIHLGVKPDEMSVYKRKGNEEVEVDCTWVWGRATEPYDHCIEYFGLGPMLLVCW